MIVVSDTSPVTALLTVGEVELLPQYFTEVVIPEGVRDELLRTHARLPPWLRVVLLKDRRRAEAYAREVDSGEAEAIALACEMGADRLLIDERRGRKLAARDDVAVIGLVGGAWVFRGTRVPVRALFENLEDGARVEDFLEWFPGVTREQVLAVLRYANETLAESVADGSGRLAASRPEA